MNRRMPARMHHLQFGQLQPEREGQEPVDDLGMQRRLVLHFGQEGGVLLPVLLTPFRRCRAIAGTDPGASESGVCHAMAFSS